MTTSPQPAVGPPTHQPPPPPRPPAPGEPWTRSSSDRVIAGVCGGLGRQLGVDPLILRVVVVVLAFFAGAGVVLYAAAWLFMPLDRTNRSVLTEALGSSSTDRTRGVLTAAALVLVLVLSAALLLEGGLVPGLLIALAVVAVLLVVRRDEAAVAPRPYGSPATEPTLTMPRAEPIPRAPPTAPSWEPPFDAPPPEAYRAAQFAPPPPPRERSYLGILTVSAMVTVLGIMGVVDVSGIAVPITAYVVAALAVVAAGLVLGAWVGRSRGLIVLGILLGLATGPAVVADAVVGSEWGDWRNADDVRVAPRTPDQLDPVYDYGAGSIRLDLTSLDFGDRDLATMIDLGAGEVIVTVPSEVDVTVDAIVDVGDLMVFDRRSGGFSPDESFTDVGVDGPGGGSLDLSIDLGLGKVEVRRATS